jgi:signal transduction histidine kinase
MDAAAAGPGGGRSHHSTPRIALIADAFLVVALPCVTAAIAIASDRTALAALARALMVAVPLGVGLYAVRQRPSERFGRVLVVAGVAWFLTTLAESDDELLYTLGRVAGWLTEALLVYLILSFPAGRLPGRLDRLIVAAACAVVAVFFLPRLLFAPAFEVPSPFTSCAAHCPDNVAFVGSEPGIVDAVLRPAGVVLVFLVMAGVVARLWWRTATATPLTRRMLAPVLAVSVSREAILGVAIVAREVDATSPVLEVAVWLLALAVPAIALAFLAGLLRWRLFAGAALQRLAECVRALPDASTLRDAFAEAFSDPSIEIVFPVSGNGAWMNSHGARVSLPSRGSGRTVSDVRNNGTVIAAILHDEGLSARPELLDAGIGLAGVVLDNQRLVAEAEASLREVRRSRARIAASAVKERRRLERDLHDGAQQRLVALRIELGLAEELLRQDPEAAAARLHELEEELDAALDDLRSLAHGVYPSLLADRGLEEALRSVTARSQLPVTLVTHDIGRYGADLESAVYFCLLEALQNVMKHARDARRVVVQLDGGSGTELTFSVRDDGYGTAGLHAGAGITNMRDRLAAVDGFVEVVSTPGVGTVVRGRVPTVAQPVA